MTAPGAAWMQTVDGRVVHLDRPPDAGSITRAALVAGLCNTMRFSGQVPGLQVSVAQHSIWGCDAILEETGDVIAAAYFLLHDGHEALKGDQTSPFKIAMVARMGAIHPMAGVAFRQALKAMEDDLDAAIHAMEGLPWPVPEPYAARVRDYDLRMLETERRCYLDRGIATPPRWPGDEEPPPQVRTHLVRYSEHRLPAALCHRLDTIIPAARRRLAGAPVVPLSRP